jgi:hypothetical protein
MRTTSSYILVLGASQKKIREERLLDEVGQKA